MIGMMLTLVLALMIVVMKNVSGQGNGPPPGLIPMKMDLNGGWSPLSYNVTLSRWVPNVFVVESPAPFKMLYSDAFCPGEMVAIYVNGTFLMNSTQVPNPPLAGPCEPKIEFPLETFKLPDVFSHANFSLPMGRHELTVNVIQSNSDFPSGVMYMRSYLDLPFNCEEVV